MSLLKVTTTNFHKVGTSYRVSVNIETNSKLEKENNYYSTIHVRAFQRLQTSLNVSPLSLTLVAGSARISSNGIKTHRSYIYSRVLNPWTDVRLALLSTQVNDVIRSMRAEFKSNPIRAILGLQPYIKP